jgi:exonuclease SbcC|nr:MAG TPA: STRUCTURAL MAINTENANCE OF CHROMOSOMES PROTEIN [Caudoviricetes sp.]
MWQLQSIRATNICAFETLEFSPIQNQATLIFGMNLDNDSQNSNGSGKSALLEAIAIGIIGEPLRKVNADEIINDRFDEAKVSIILSNRILECQMVVIRAFSRKNPQAIQVFLQKGQADAEEIKQASVADYNKYILDQIGLSKEDILKNFILTARKYQSFLSSSDKDKKEIINRFSNGILVDDSLEVLNEDMIPVQEELQQSEKKVAECNGRVSALSSEIERAINDAVSRKESTKERIESMKQSIIDKRAQIRQCKQNIDAMDIQLDKLDELDEKMQNLEKSDVDTESAYQKINMEFATLSLSPIKEYIKQISSLKIEIGDLQKTIQMLNESANASCKHVDSLSKELSLAQSNHTEKSAKIKSDKQAIEQQIESMREQARQLREKSKTLGVNRNSINTAIASLEKQLAGVIQCPKCSYEFTLDQDVDIHAARIELENSKKNLVQIENDIAAAEESYNECIENGKQKQDERYALEQQERELDDNCKALASKLKSAQSEHELIEVKFKSATGKLENLQETVGGMRKQMFDEVFDSIDSAIKNAERKIQNEENEIDTLNGSISAYEQNIQELETSMNDDIVSHLQESKTKYQADLAIAISKQEEISARWSILKAQESAFMEFKTYLANSKINAISQITNEFLAAIGSDIRVALSGYTMLKSGKVRDTISVSLIRDGIDCGSFDKFSAGEKCRVELASVLALHKLSNVNCEDGKGLNLLIIDEILDSTDESGLSNVFKALNDTQVTALVVSHGNIAENYPNRLIVSKKNGVSSLNEKS